MMLNCLMIIILIVGVRVAASDIDHSSSSFASSPSLASRLTLVPDHVVIGYIRSNFQKTYPDEAVRNEMVKNVLAEITESCCSLKTDAEIKEKIEQMDDDYEEKYGINLDYGFRYLNELLIIAATGLSAQAGVYSVIEYRYQVTPAGQDLNCPVKKHMKKDSFFSLKTVSDSLVETSRSFEAEDKFMGNPLSPRL